MWQIVISSKFFIIKTLIFPPLFSSGKVYHLNSSRLPIPFVFFFLLSTTLFEIKIQRKTWEPPEISISSGTSLVVWWLKTPHFQCRGPGFNPWWGYRALPAATKHSHATSKDSAHHNKDQRSCLQQLRHSTTK